MKVYESEFKLTNPVNDLKAAREYLTEDDMTKYLTAAAEQEYRGTYFERGLPSTIRDIQWNLDDENSGRITLIADRELTENELAFVSGWVSGQCSDGLGEGFEQQKFAEVESEVNYGEYDYDEECDMASFDWNTNEYLFTDVTAMRQDYVKERLAEKDAEAPSSLSA